MQMMATQNNMRPFRISFGRTAEVGEYACEGGVGTCGNRVVKIGRTAAKMKKPTVVMKKR